VSNYVDQQTLKQDDDYILPHQRLWMFDVLVCPLSRQQSVTCCSRSFVKQPSIARHCCPPLSPSSAVVLNHISSHFLIPLSDSSLICTVPAQSLVILDTIIVITLLTFNSYLTLLTTICYQGYNEDDKIIASHGKNLRTTYTV